MFQIGKNRSTNYVTFLTADAGRTDGRTDAGPTDGRTDVYVILYNVQCICIALDRQKRQFIHMLTAAFNDLHIKNSKHDKKVILFSSTLTHSQYDAGRITFL